MAGLVAPEKIGWLNHRALMAWLWFLHRKPKAFMSELMEAKPWPQVRLGLLALLHLYPYLVLLVFVGRLVVFEGFGVPLEDGFVGGWEGHLTTAFVASLKGIAIGIALGIYIEFAVGISVGIFVGISGGLAREIAIGISVGFTVGIALGLAVGYVLGIALGIAGRIVDGIAGGIVLGIAGGTAVRFAGGDSQAGLAISVSLPLAFWLYYFRLYYQPFHLLSIWPTLQPKWYHRHPVAWDDVCRLPFKGLHRLLVALHQQNPAYAEIEIERLITSYPSQRQEALIARAIILAEQSLKITDLSRLDSLINKLPEGDKGWLAQTPIIRQKVAEIARQRNLVNSAGRAYMRKAHLETLASQIEALMHQVAGFRQPLASAFGRATKSWLIRTRDEMEQSQTMVRHHPVFQVFRAGDPVDRDQEAFVPRLATIGRIERQLTMAQGCPGLLLYGRRRMGKSTLLRNLDGFLPERYRIARVSLQDPRLFAGQDQLAAGIGEAVNRVWPQAPVVPGPATGLAHFFSQLEAWNNALEDDQRLLLTVDEYEMLDIKIGEGVFHQDLLATLRESIQQHRNLVWILTGSHDTSELEHAPWESYLVSIRTVELPFFTLDETRLLLTDPLSRSSFWGHREDRPRMDSRFWGENGIEQVHDYSGGWPHLVQLMAETLVDMANDYEKSTIDDKMFQKSLDESVVAGNKVLFQLLMGECRSEEEQGYLYGFQTIAQQAPPSNPIIAKSLRHRQLIIEEDGKWRLRVPLMRHWLKHNK